MSNLGILTNIKLGNHFIQRFNDRYFGRSHQWNISDCKSYIDKIMTPTQKKLLDTLPRNYNLDIAPMILLIYREMVQS